jgi:signal peptidase I
MKIHFSVLNIVLLFFILWILSLVSAAVLVGYVVGVRSELFDTAPDLFVYLLLVSILIGSISFVLGICSAAVYFLKKSNRTANVFVFLVWLVVLLAVFPFYLLYILVEPRKIFLSLIQANTRTKRTRIPVKKIFVRSFSFVFIAFTLVPLWTTLYVSVFFIGKQMIGYTEETIQISGTGSMYPTFLKGEGKDPKELAQQIVGSPGMLPYPNGLVFAGRRYFGYELGRGDIVVVENEKIRELTTVLHGTPSGWVKRVIGMPKDTIELSGGIVYINGEPQKEPYTALPRSTFGEGFLRECMTVTVPDNAVFVMGDNRKGSGDSREIGFVDIQAIHHVLPFTYQKGRLDTYWRDTTKDFEPSAKITLDTKEYVELLNKKRKEAGAKELTYQDKLEKSAQKRAEVVMKYDDFSFEATKSGYTMQKVMSEANYYNIVYGEAPTQGYYTAAELIEYQFSFPESKKFLTDSTYQDIGIAVVEGEIQGCPTQVIMQHIAGYVPPNYKQQDIDSWKTVLKQIQDIQPGWNRLKDYSEFYAKNRVDVDRMTEILSLRISHLTAIVRRMEANQWLTSKEQTMADQDEVLFQEQESLAKKLNAQ